MKIRLACAVSAGLLLYVSMSLAMPRGWVTGTSEVIASAPIEVAGRHSSSSSARSSSSSSSSSARASAGRSAGSGARWSGRSSPATRGYIVAPFRTNASPQFTNSTPFYARPRTRVVRRLAPLAVLSTIYIGSRYYYPYRYLPYDGPVCSGLTANGCEMRWMEVPTDYSDEMVWQCVEFCPQQ